MENQTVNLDATVNNAKRASTMVVNVLDQLYDICLNQNLRIKDLEAQIEALRKPPINLGELTPLSDQK